MENVKHTYQVLIIGGGPSGIATALTLHARGIRCCVVEALETPVRKAGEAIPPNAKPLLKQLGILSLLEHNTIRCCIIELNLWTKKTPSILHTSL